MPTDPAHLPASFAATDALLVDQRLYALAIEPLAIYFALTETVPPFAGTATGGGRGYQATWELRDGRFYLIAIRGTLAGGRAGSLGDLFPDFGKRVFAHWFSGTLHARSPRTAIGTVVLDGIDTGVTDLAPTFEIERGVLIPMAPAVAAPSPFVAAPTIVARPEVAA